MRGAEGREHANRHGSGDPVDDLRTVRQDHGKRRPAQRPRFQCIGGAVLVVEFTSTAGHSFFQAYFPDGTDVGYGRQQIDRRGGRFVLPVQAKARIADPYRAAFDYHCRLDMPADPISADARASCLF